MDHLEMRQRNVAETMAVLYRTSPATMADLQSASGLSRRTLEAIIDELLTRGWVRELEPETPQSPRPAGRPARRFAFAFDAANIVGIELDAAGIRAVIADLAATVLADVAVSLPMASSRQDRLRLLDDCISNLLRDAGTTRDAVLSVTVATPGIVHDDGTVDLPMTMPEWTGFSLASAVGELFSCPVRVENDAKLAAVGEKWTIGDRVQDFVYFFADDDRLGTGVVIRNQLHRGVNGAAGEVTWATGLGLNSLTSPLLRGLDDTASPDHVTAIALVEAARSGRSDAIAEVESLARQLMRAISAIGWILAPEEIILGGTLGSIHDLLVPAIEALMRTDEHPPQLRIRRSMSGRDAVLDGCLRMSVESLGARLGDIENVRDLRHLGSQAAAG